MLKLLVIADDFTGALDTGVQFSSQGIQTVVTTKREIDYEKLADDVEVLVIDTESRYLSFEEAYQLVTDIVKEARIQEVPFFYKKIDSALRGNISSEIKGLLDQFPDQRLAMVPAYPAIQRVVREGKLYIGDILVANSVFAQDPYEPVTESDIAKRLRQEAGIDSVLIDSRNSLSHKERLLLFDSETDEELAVIADLLRQEDCLHVTIGCAGFAKYLVKQLFPEKQSPIPKIRTGLLVVCGSVNPITRQQIEYSEEKGGLRIPLSPKELLEEAYWQSSQGQKKIAGYLTSIATNDLTIFETLSEETSQGIIEYSQRHGLSRSEIRFKIGKSLGELTKQLLEKDLDRTPLFTGGDTLFQSMQVLEIDQIQPVCEISPGVVLAELVWKNKVISVITKSGGFGRPELFEDIKQLIQKEEIYVS